MTVRQRIRTLRLMEKMENAHSHNHPNVERTDDGALSYRDDNGEVLFTVRMEERD